MMAAGAVHVAVLELLGSRTAHLDHFDVEMQRLIGERMIAVEGDHIAHDRGHREYPHALVGLRLKLHALADLARALQGTLGHALHQRLVARAVALFGRQTHLDAVPLGFALERLFQAGYEIAVPLDVGERLAARRAVEYLAVVVFERVVDQHHAICRYLHVGFSCAPFSTRPLRQPPWLPLSAVADAETKLFRDSPLEVVGTGFGDAHLRPIADLQAAAVQDAHHAVDLRRIAR